MKTIAKQIDLLVLALTAALATSGCSFDSFRSPSSDYVKPGELSVDVESLPDPNERKPTSADKVSINAFESTRRTESPERLLAQATEYFEQKRYHDSARLYKKYLMTPNAGTASPDILATAHYRIGYVADKKMQYHEACQEYRQALEITPFNNDYLFAYARACYEAGDYTTAEAQFVQLTTRAPGYPDGQYYYGLTLLESGDRTRALQPLTAARGDLEAYFLLADKYYAKGELQFAVQAEAQMGQIAASLGLNAPELPHKSKVASSFNVASTSTPSPTPASASPQVALPQPAQGITTPSANPAVPNVPSTTTVNPQQEPQIASQAPTSNVVPSLVMPTETPDLAANVSPTSVAPNNLNAPDEPKSACVPQTTPTPATIAIPQSVTPNTVIPQVAQAPTLPNPTLNVPLYASPVPAQPSVQTTQIAQTQPVPTPAINAPMNAVPTQTQASAPIAQAPTIPNPTSNVPLNVTPIQPQINAQIAQAPTIPNTTLNVTPIQPQINAQIAQAPTIPNTTLNVTPIQPQINAQIAQAPTIPTPIVPYENPTNTVAATSNPLPVSATSESVGFANSVPGVAPTQIVNVPLPAATSERYVESVENDDWNEDEFAFACSGQPGDPIPTASLIGTAESFPTSPSEDFLAANENVSKAPQPETIGVATVPEPVMNPTQKEELSQVDQLLNEKLENLSVRDETSGLAQTVVPIVPESLQELEDVSSTPATPKESEAVVNNLASSRFDNSNDVGTAPSQIPVASTPSFIDFRPGSTMNASLVTVPPRQTPDEPIPSVQTKAEVPVATFASDYNVPQFPSCEPGAGQLESFTPIQRVYTIKDMERLASDWALFEQNLLTYLTPTPVAEEMVAQTKNFVPQALPTTVPRQGYASPEEFFRSTPTMEAPVAQQAPTPNFVANGTTLAEQPSEISISKIPTRSNSTSEERLQAAREAGAQVVELSPEQYRQALMLNTSRR